jgi:hypothetical protein
MSPEALFVLIGALASAVAVIVSVIAYRYTASRDVRKDDAETIKLVINQSLAPVMDKIHDSGEKIAVLETKMDMLWAQLQKDMARIMHSPEPSRAHIDALMDKIIDNVPLTSDEELELRSILHDIMLYEPGHSPDLGFPVKNGEQILAAFLLRSLDYVPIRGSGRHHRVQIQIQR